MTNLTLRRVIDAPVQRVYAAWTDPELLRQWLAPGNAVASRAVADVAVGQDLLIEMLRTNGQRRLARGLYLEVAPLRRLVHTWRWDGCEIETLVTIEVEPKSADTGIRSGNCDRSRRAEIHRVPARDDLKVPGQRPFAGHRSRPPGAPRL